MFRADHSTALADANGAGKDGYTEGNPGTVAATVLTAEAMNAIQEEIANVIEAFGITLSKPDQDQLLAAISEIAALVADRLVVPHGMDITASDADGTAVSAIGDGNGDGASGESQGGSGNGLRGTKSGGGSGAGVRGETTTAGGNGVQARATSGAGSALKVISASSTPAVDVDASAGTGAHFRLDAVATPASPADGDIWFDGTDLKIRIAGVTRTVTVT